MQQKLVLPNHVEWIDLAVPFCLHEIVVYTPNKRACRVVKHISNDVQKIRPNSSNFFALRKRCARVDVLAGEIGKVICLRIS